MDNEEHVASTENYTLTAGSAENEEAFFPIAVKLGVILTTGSGPKPVMMLEGVRQNAGDDFDFTKLPIDAETEDIYINIDDNRVKSMLLQTLAFTLLSRDSTEKLRGLIQTLVDTDQENGEWPQVFADLHQNWEGISKAAEVIVEKMRDEHDDHQG